jgi:hypothetical protein
MSVTIKSILIPDMFQIVAQMLDTTSALQLRNTCRQFSDRGKKVHSGYTRRINYDGVVSIAQLPKFASYARCLHPRAIAVGANSIRRIQQCPGLREMLTRVEHVVFRYDVDSQLPEDWWPPNTTRVDHQHRALTSWPDTIQELSIVFAETSDLDLDIADEEVHAIAHPPFPCLPSALRVLNVTGKLPMPIKRGDLPASLERLSLGDMEGRLHCDIEDGALPESLTHLTVGRVSNYMFLRWRFPSSLQYLKLNLGYTSTNPDAFAAFIAALPDSLEILDIVNPISRMIVTKWPASLRELHMNPFIFSSVYLDNGEVGPRIQNKLHFEAFPSTFKSLHLWFRKRQLVHDPSTNYFYVYHNESKVYRFSPGEDHITLGDAYMDRDGLVVLHRKPQ